MCLNSIRAEDMQRTASLYIAGLKPDRRDSYWSWMYSCLLQYYTYSTWMLLLLLCDKKYFWAPKRDAGEILVKILRGLFIYLFLYLFAHARWKSFQFLSLSINAEKCNCRSIYNIYHVFRIAFCRRYLYILFKIQFLQKIIYV